MNTAGLRLHYSAVDLLAEEADIAGGHAETLAAGVDDMRCKLTGQRLGALGLALDAFDTAQGGWLRGLAVLLDGRERLNAAAALGRQFHAAVTGNADADAFNRHLAGYRRDIADEWRIFQDSCHEVTG